jgi:hypothetical protein
MIRNRSRRMTVAQLKERMDARFKAADKRFDAVDERFDRLTARIDAGFHSMHDKLNAILRALNTTVRTTNPRVCERRPGQRLFDTCAERRAVGGALYQKLRSEDPEDRSGVSKSWLLPTRIAFRRALATGQLSLPSTSELIGRRGERGSAAPYVSAGEQDWRTVPALDVTLPMPSSNGAPIFSVVYCRRWRVPIY